MNMTIQMEQQDNFNQIERIVEKYTIVYKIKLLKPMESQQQTVTKWEDCI